MVSGLEYNSSPNPYISQVEVAADALSGCIDLPSVNTLQIFEKKQARNYHQKIKLLCCIKQSFHEICGIAASLNVQLAVQDGHYLLEK